MLRDNRFSRLVRDTLEYVRTFRRLPGFGLRTHLRDRLGRWRDPITFPDWIAPDYAERVDLKVRHREIVASMNCQTMGSHYGLVAAPLWSGIFATSHPGFTGLPVKVRYPFFDLRLVSYLQSIPPIPWLEKKFLLREAMQDMLPEAVRVRPKTVLRGNPHYKLRQQQGIQSWIEKLAAMPELAPYVNGKRLLQRLEAIKKLGLVGHCQIHPALVLAYWLHSKTGEPCHS